MNIKDRPRKKIKIIIMHIRNDILTPLYIDFLAKIIWQLIHRELSKTKAVKVIEEDWNYLIILDACRYDTFLEVIDEKAKYVISDGTSTQEWLK